MTSKVIEYAVSIAELAARIAKGGEAIIAELSTLPPAQELPEVTAAPFDRDRFFSALRPVFNGSYTQAQVDGIERAINLALGLPVTASPLGISPEAFARAAAQLEPENVAHGLAAIRAVDEVESAGGGLDKARGDILDLDGPGGFIDGEYLPKILFEAHKFAKHTGGKFTASHPNLSSAKWNRALYIGGQGEWTRLHKAMQLDREAALKSASWGRYQILGENYATAGYDNVEAFVAAMKAGEEAQLEAFVGFVKGNKLVDAFRSISPNASDCIAFARGYNGSGYAANNYHVKIAKAFAKWSRK